MDILIGRGDDGEAGDRERDAEDLEFLLFAFDRIVVCRLRVREEEGDLIRIVIDRRDHHAVRSHDDEGDELIIFGRG